MTTEKRRQQNKEAQARFRMKTKSTLEQLLALIKELLTELEGGRIPPHLIQKVRDLIKGNEKC